MTLFRLPAKWREPLVADRTLDVMAAAFWLAYAGWGIASTITGLAPITDAGGNTYRLFWGAAIGGFSLAAAFACIITFIGSRTLQTRIRKKVTELISVCALTGFVSVYPLVVILEVIGGEMGRLAPAFLALSFVIFPTWRVRHLFLRIRKLREVANGASQ